MPEIVLPAPLWRRLAALMYDSLLFVALLMGGLTLAIPLVAYFVASDAQTPLTNFKVLSVYLFAVGLIFFGISWTRAGQTLGMKVWKLKVQRLDGSLMRWPTAAVRLAFGLAPLVLGLQLGKSLSGPLAEAGLFALAPANQQAIFSALSGAGVMALLSYLPCLFGAQSRALCDWAAGTEVQLHRL